MNAPTLTPNNPGELFVNPDNLRDSKLYRELNAFWAIEIIENGSDEKADVTLTAWQYIADNDLWRGLQGFYGRTVHELLASGQIQGKATRV